MDADRCKLTLNLGNEKREIYIEKGANLLQALIDAGIYLDSPCAGKSLCGKCRVKVLGGGASGVTSEEEHHIGKEIKNGIRLACCINVLKDIEISLPDYNKNAKIMTEFSDFKTDLTPLIKENRVNQYGVAVDIGTTTVVCYLADLNTGRQVDVWSELNVQVSYGGDVITRISYCIENPKGLNLLSKLIAEQISKMIFELAERNRVDIKDVLCLSIAGNTVMLHLLLGLSVSGLAVSPFVPVETKTLTGLAADFGIKLHDACTVVILPSISAFVGADIAAGVLSSGLYKNDKLCLFLDIGTNGEIAMGNRDGIFCCSAAAGPAFEGANIKHGMGGVEGAINTVRFADGNFRFTTIGNIRPAGICGSGVVDVIAAMLEAKVIDETGRLLPPEKIKSEKLKDRITETDGIRSFTLAYAEDTLTGEPIVITQKDIREIQLAKAAIAAGVRLLAKSMGKSIDDIECVFLAGGFGSFIDKKSAVEIGLLPGSFKDKIIPVGNASGKGALMALLSKESRQALNKISSEAKYIELSSLPEFQDTLAECIYFK